MHLFNMVPWKDQEQSVEATNPWNCSALTNDNWTVHAPTPGKEAEILTWERFQSKGEHKTFDLPSKPVFYDVDWMLCLVTNYNRISPVQNNQLASTEDNGVKW